jgi:flagellar basal body P-ring formation protein FlgA
VVHTARPLKKGTVLQVEDIELKRIPVSSSLQQRQVSAMEDVIGKQLTRDLGPSHPLSLDDVGDAVLIKRGSTVAIVYEVPGLRVTAKGQAKEDGSKGRIVKVVNVKSRRILDCRVVDAETVEAVP